MGERLGWWWRHFAVACLKPLLIVMTRRTWSGMEHVPRTGGMIFAVSHHSEFDPLVVSHFVYNSGRWPQFLAKSSLFKVPALGPFLRSVKQIPVYRGTADAAKSVEAAAAAIQAGEAVIIYPEGTTPKQGDLWPGRGKTGIARLVLATGAPVIPVVSWGAQRILDPRVGKFRPRWRTPVTVVAGPPVDLSRWAGAAPTSANLYAITETVMAVLREMLADVRGETPPPAESAAGRQPSASRQPSAVADEVGEAGEAR